MAGLSWFHQGVSLELGLSAKSRVLSLESWNRMKRRRRGVFGGWVKVVSSRVNKSLRNNRWGLNSVVKIIDRKQ